MSSTIIVPPIRAPLTDPRSGTAGRSRTAALAEAQTTKEWYLFFEKLARALGRLDSSVNQGTHEERLATNPANVPDGALWVETDRGNVIYQVQQDADGEPVWVYLAGTMSGTLTPDERPTDLGELDAGFQFAATDTGAIYQWDGTAWVDITLDSGALFLQETAYAMVLENGWANYGGAFQTASYLRDRNGWVHLRGLIKSGTMAAGTVLTTLLAGYRPLAVEILPAYYAGGMARIDVEPGGNVVLMSTLSTNTFLTLSGISFSMQG